jgi:hypothetical protein
VSVSVLGGEIPQIRIVIVVVVVVVIDKPRVGRERVLAVVRVFIGLSGLSGFGGYRVFSVLAVFDRLSVFSVERREIIPRLREGIVESGPTLVVWGFIDIGVGWVGCGCGCGNGGRGGGGEGEGTGISTETHTLHASTSATGDCVEEELVGTSATMCVVVGW